jgi:fucose permease
MTAVLHRGLPWQRGYAIVGIAQAALAGCFALTFRWWPRTGGTEVHADHSAASLRATLAHPGARLGILVFFLYSGVEASIGAWTYTLLTIARAIDAVQAAAIVTSYWGSLTAGRLLAAFAGGRIRVQRMLMIALAGLMLGVVLVWIDLGVIVTFAGITIAGCACGPVFPTLVATTPARVGPGHGANAVGFQIASSALGLSLLPGLVGVIAKRAGVESISTLLVALAAIVLIAYRRLDAVAPAGD